MAQFLLTYTQSCLVKISQRSAFFVHIWRFKVRSTKIIVNNENASDVSPDKTEANAAIVGRKKFFRKVPKYFNFGLLCSSGTLVFKMGLLVLWLSAAAPLCTQTWRTVTQKLLGGCVPWEKWQIFPQKDVPFCQKMP